VKYQVQVVWNREINWVNQGEPVPAIDHAIKYARQMENMGDGACVKKVRIVDSEGNTVWIYGKAVE
jgi:hypothetical protein